MEEAVNKEGRRKEETHFTEKVSWAATFWLPTFPSPDEVAGTDYGIYYLLHPQPATPVSSNRSR